MRVRLSDILIGAVLLAFAGFSPSIAEAGYVFTTDSSAASLLSADASMAAPAQDERTPGDTPDDRAKDLFERGLTGHTSPTGASAPTGPSAGGPTAAVLSTVELSAAAQLTQRLGPAGKVWLPPAFLSGIFRPPRFTV